MGLSRRMKPWVSVSARSAAEVVGRTDESLTLHPTLLHQTNVEPVGGGGGVRRQGMDVSPHAGGAM